MGTQPPHKEVPQDEEDEDTKSNVFCNVYDILPRVNAIMRCFDSDWGIYHTGVQVHGLEFAYGGHPDSGTGVFCARPRSAKGARFREQVPVGYAELDSLELRQAVAEISKQWPGDMYDPFKRNCNHFSDFLCRELTGQGAPPYINRFTTSSLVRGVFYRCLVPLGRCLERFYEPPSITYSDDIGVAGEDGTAGDELGITGVRGINQVLLEAATMQKAKANKLFGEKAYSAAKSSYWKALGYLDAMSRRTEEDAEACRQVEAVRRALLLNLAACDLKSESYEEAVGRCREVLALDPGNAKALYRRGVALSHLGAYQEALADLRGLLQGTEGGALDAATQRDVRREVERVRGLVEDERERDRAMARRMLGAS
uniref:PPPDE domain-containing protein n=1 Tax=Pyrodinium bahamense TaxID=73915 RepID=A0A7S0AHT5_9DINO